MREENNKKLKDFLFQTVLMQRIKSNIVKNKLLFLLSLLKLSLYSNFKMQFSTIDNEVTFYQGKQGKYYVIDGEKYDIHFPLYWATCHNGTNPEYPEDIAGPKSCLNCKEYGSVNGVFVSYCLNCAYYVFEETREGSDGTPESLQSLSYLRDVPISEIGDVYQEEQSDDYCIEVIEEDWPEAIDPNLVSVDDLYRENDSNDILDEDDIYCDLYYDNERREREMRFNRKEYHNTPASLVF